MTNSIAPLARRWMTTTPLPDRELLTRRTLLRTALVGPPLLGAAGMEFFSHGIRAAVAQTTNVQTANAPDRMPEGGHVTVAGPDGGELDTWSQVMVPALNSFLPVVSPLRRSLAGGIDGVTGANQFAAQTLPDGASALLVPGTAMIAKLRGDPRVQYGAVRWIHTLTAMSTAMVAGRITASQLIPGQKLRIGVSGINGPENAALLGLELLGLQPIPVGGLIDQGTMELAFSQHAIDVLLLRGPNIANTLNATGAHPICVLGNPDTNGLFTRDPTLPELPQLAELLDGLPDTRLTTAWRAAATTAQLRFSLILPPLTPRGSVAIWRRAAEQTIATAELQAMTTTLAVRLHPNPEIIEALISDPDALSTMREWSLERQRR